MQYVYLWKNLVENHGKHIIPNFGVTLYDLLIISLHVKLQSFHGNFPYLLVLRWHQNLNNL